jgi:tetratricopeptide (TPR) repeat protein
LGAMHLAEAQARFWRGEYHLAERAAREATTMTSGVRRYDAIRELVSALGQQARFAEVQRWTEEVHGSIQHEGEPSRTTCLLRAAGYLVSAGRCELPEQIAKEAETSTQIEPSTLARILDLRGKLEILAGNQGAALEKFEGSLRALQQSGSVRAITEMLANVGFTLCDLGALEEAEERLSAALANSERMNLGYVTVMVLTNLALVRAYNGHLLDARSTALRARSLAAEQGDSRLLGVAESYLSRIADLSENTAEAEAHARNAVEAFAQIPPFQPLGQATLARALLARSRVQEALREIVAANTQMEAQGSAEDGEALVRLTLVDCLLAAGDETGAIAALHTAHARLAARAAHIEDSSMREKFLQRIPDHRRTIELAQRLNSV